MSTVDFINRNFTVHVGAELTNDPQADAARALRQNYLWLRKKGPKEGRVSAVWMILREGMQPILSVPILSKSDDEVINFELAQHTFFTTCAQILADFKVPVMMINIGQRGMTLSDCFVTYDPRITRVCTPGLVDTFDFTEQPTKASSKAHGAIWKAAEAARKQEQK